MRAILQAPSLSYATGKLVSSGWRMGQTEYSRQFCSFPTHSLAVVCFILIYIHRSVLVSLSGHLRSGVGSWTSEVEEGPVVLPTLALFLFRDLNLLSIHHFSKLQVVKLNRLLV